MTGGNVTNDFLDNLAAQQYRKAHRDNIKALQREIEELKNLKEPRWFLRHVDKR